jgi:hypothetical protein
VSIRGPIDVLESLHGDQLTLIDMIDLALSLKEAGIPIDIMAQAWGRETTWIEVLFTIARDPVARVLLNAERLLSVEAWEQFISLPPVARKRLLDTDEPITAERCERWPRDRRKTSRRSSSTRRIPIPREERRT